MHKNIAIIPARGGSKRVPRKNIKDFLGKPIIAYSIELAIQSGLFEEIMVSTDDDEIADIAIQYGASIPFKRSKENADDYATLADVIEEVVKKYNDNGIHFNNFCCILPTSPLISTQQIKEAYMLLQNNKYTSVTPVVPFSYPILRSLKFDEDNYLSMVWPEYITSRSQDLSTAYHDSGSFYWVNTNIFFKEKVLFTKDGTGIILNEMQVQDIDNETDWKLAELKYTMLYAK